MSGQYFRPLTSDDVTEGAPNPSCVVCMRQLPVSDLMMFNEPGSMSVHIVCRACRTQVQGLMSTMVHPCKASPNQMTLTPTKDATGRFKCEICGKDFQFESKMVRHLKSHSDEKKYKCDYCGTKFKHNFHRINHMRSKCEAMKMQFGQTSDLKSADLYPMGSFQNNN